MKPREAGFTLIELLVALTIFAMLSAAGVLLLGNAVSAQSQVSDHLEEQGGMLRVVSLLDQDMREVTPRISRTENGLLAPVFFSRAPSESEPFLQFVRAGWANPEDLRRSDLQKVEYWLRSGKFERRIYPMVDGTQGREPSVLVDQVDGIAIAFRDHDGEWVDQWQRSDPLDMPRAMRLDIDRTGKQRLTLMFRLPASSDEGGSEEAANNG